MTPDTAAPLPPLEGAILIGERRQIRQPADADFLLIDVAGSMLDAVRKSITHRADCKSPQVVLQAAGTKRRMECKCCHAGAVLITAEHYDLAWKYEQQEAQPSTTVGSYD